MNIDVISAMLGDRLDQPTEASLIARGMAVEMARGQLTAAGATVPSMRGEVRDRGGSATRAQGRRWCHRMVMPIDAAAGSAVCYWYLRGWMGSNRAAR
jgi:hypothetical protein